MVITIVIVSSIHANNVTIVVKPYLLVFVSASQAEELDDLEVAPRGRLSERRLWHSRLEYIIV